MKGCVVFYDTLQTFLQLYFLKFSFLPPVVNVKGLFWESGIRGYCLRYGFSIGAKMNNLRSGRSYYFIDEIKINNMELELYKEDIMKLGDAIFPMKDCVVIEIFSSDDTVWITEILLRNVLKLFGEDYKVISFDELTPEDDNEVEVASMFFVTNLPWKEIEGLGFKL